ncbi:MAG: hypothetical protein WDZ70_00655 [Candidatus Paceibacterota bacterium]
MPLEHRKGDIIRTPGAADTLLTRRWNDRKIYLSTADRKEEVGDASGAKHYRDIAAAVSENLCAFAQAL